MALNEKFDEFLQRPRCDVVLTRDQSLYINGVQIGGVTSLETSTNVRKVGHGEMEIRLVIVPTSVQYGQAPEAVKVSDGWEAEPDKPKRERPPMSDVPERVGRYQAVREALLLKEKK